MSKTLVAYFSATGNTVHTAETIAKAAEADTLYEIVAADPYKGKDLNWKDPNSRVSKEEKNPSTRPAIASDPLTMDYDVIYLGFPIWWGTAPKIINSFLELYDTVGKTIIPFSTSEGSDIMHTASRLKTESAPDADWHAGTVITKDMTEDAISKWIKDSLKSPSVTDGELSAEDGYISK